MREALKKPKKLDGYQACFGRSRAEAFDVDPVVEALAADAVRRQELEHPLEVAHDDEHEPAGEAEDWRAPVEPLRLHSGDRR